MSEPLTILVADDSPTQAAFLKMALKARGHEVLIARDGIETVEAAYRHTPDLVVSDVIMPRMNGYQVCRLLKDDQSLAGIPIILLTSLDEKTDKFWGTKSGADGYMIKVSDPNALVDAIEGFVSARKIVPRPRSAAASGKNGEASRSGDILERVVRVLDRNLFGSTVLNEMGNLVQGLEDYRKVMNSLLEILSNVFDYDLGVIALLGDDSREYFCHVNEPVDENFIAEACSRVDAHLLRELRTASFQGPRTTEIFDPVGKGRDAAPAALGSEYLRTLVTKDVPTGAIALFGRKENVFTERTVSTFEIIAKQANMVIDYARLYERNKQLSITDGLTKVYNHRYFQEILTREFARSARQKLLLGLAILDIDRFKSFNDTYGHQQGDIVLAELAAILKKSLRTQDTVCRYGGEEFTVLMTDTSAADAARVAERLRKAVEVYEFPCREGTIKVTISLGVAAIPDPFICNAAELISAADQALYRAKKTGRNRVCRADDREDTEG
jgi:two-component system cell cycle response regulator